MEIVMCIQIQSGAPLERWLVGEGSDDQTRLWKESKAGIKTSNLVNFSSTKKTHNWAEEMNNNRLIRIDQLIREIWKGKRNEQCVGSKYVKEHLRQNGLVLYGLVWILWLWVWVFSLKLATFGTRHVLTNNCIVAPKAWHLSFILWFQIKYVK